MTEIVLLAEEERPKKSESYKSLTGSMALGVSCAYYGPYLLPLRAIGWRGDDLNGVDHLESDGLNLRDGHLGLE